MRGDGIDCLQPSTTRSREAKHVRHVPRMMNFRLRSVNGESRRNSSIKLDMP